MDRKELIDKYLKFFESKGHFVIKGAPLIPENDPTVLFTTAGMHPLVPFLLGEKHPQGNRLCDVQRCIRTVDIDEVGDSSHHTFFEMLGNWSLGDYFKEGAIKMTFEFLTEVLGMSKDRLAVSVFSGDDRSGLDEESMLVWKSLGFSEERIARIDDNWWGPAGNTGPCGPDTEMFYWKLNNTPAPDKFNPDDSNWVEIGNDVLMQFVKDSDGSYKTAEQKNVDFGGGVERMVAVLNGFEDNYLADMWKPIIEKIEEISGKSYSGNEREMRIIADHIKAAVFIIADGAVSSNSEQGYVLRRLIRRAIRSLKKLDVPILEMDSTVEIARVVVQIYDDYEILQKNKDKIFNELKQEEDRFQKTLDKGLREFQKMCVDTVIDGKEAFLLYQSFGFPIEMIKELAEENGAKVDEKGFEKEFNRHQELSRTASAGKFKSGLADHSEETTRLHTACHLLNEALRKVLKNEDIHQKGSNITQERLRFDFNFDRKLTDEEKKEIEDLVNEKIKEGLEVKFEEMAFDRARELGAQGVFENKYGDVVKVYSIGDFSKELCTGPHVGNTSELGYFKIVKEESSGAGVRRIKAVLE